MCVYVYILLGSMYSLYVCMYCMHTHTTVYIYAQGKYYA